ncbi:MAG: PRC-barrel domain containing protein [Proteobacteria bacterium]|nr:PRC-barrel domain containing protein [Pseudomonadota bacterium]
MLRNLQDLDGYMIGATDGNVGHVKDFYLDDIAWVVRYLVVETGDWLASRKVLISPIAIHHPDWDKKILPVSISQEQVKSSPDIDTDKPVSRQHEMQYLSYYGYPYYWDGVGILAGSMTPDMFLPENASPPADRVLRKNSELAVAEADQAQHRDDDPHLRSSASLTGYHVHATDGEIGHVQGFLIDERSWAIRYIIVDTSNWWLGHQVLIAPQWFKDVSWDEEKISVDLSRQSVADAPPYDPSLVLNRVQESGLYAHYKRVGYWPEEIARESVVSRGLL